MDNILKAIGDALGPKGLTLTLVLLCLYYLTIGGAKILDLIKGITPEKRLSLQKTEMEILKLQYEIAALRKTNDLPEIAPRPAVEAAIQLADKPAESTLVRRLWSAHLGRYVVIATTFLLELFGFLCAGIIVLAIRWYLRGGQMGQSDVYVACAIAALGATSFYVSLNRIAHVLRTEAPKLHARLVIAASISAALATIGLWIKQAV